VGAGLVASLSLLGGTPWNQSVEQKFTAVNLGTKLSDFTRPKLLVQTFFSARDERSFRLM
jgi:hypothetical protein